MGISSYWNSSASSNYSWKPIGYVYCQQLQHIHYLQAEQSLRCPRWIVPLAGDAMPSQSSGDHPQTALGCKRIISSTPCWHPSRGHILYGSLMRQMSWHDVGGIAITKNAPSEICFHLKDGWARDQHPQRLPCPSKTKGVSADEFRWNAKINLFYEQALTGLFRLSVSELGISFIYNLALQQIA